MKGWCNFWTGDYFDPNKKARKGLLAHWMFDDYRRLERIFNSENWSSTYADKDFLEEDLKWLHKRVVFGLVKHPDITFNDVTESKFIRNMRRWLKVVSVLKDEPDMRLISTYLFNI